MPCPRSAPLLFLFALCSCGGAQPDAGVRAPEAPTRSLSPSNIAANAESLRRELERRGFGALASKLAALARPGLSLAPTSAHDDEPCTRLGGSAWLPTDVAWPTYEGRSLAFVAQLRLEELPAAHVPDLPDKGVLSFFYVQDQSVFGIDRSDRGAFQVLYCADASRCVERSFPDDVTQDCRFRAVPQQGIATMSLPNCSLARTAQQTTDELLDAYGELRHEIHFAHGRGHQVGGFELAIQSETMAEDVAEITGGQHADAADWLLLLQLESDDDAGWMWGDVGSIYFWIRRDDLRARDFSKIWMVYECH